MQRIAVCMVISCVLMTQGVFAQAAPPPQTAEDIRQAMFEAQVALMGGDLIKAERAINAAHDLYHTGLSAELASAVPDVDERLRDELTRALDAAQSGNTPALAALRSQVWTGLLEGSSHIVYAALSEGDGATAARWLPLRDFRVSTRFSRPGADATLAVAALSDGKLTADAVLAAARADLLDTYQAQLNAALADVDEARVNQFALRLAEETGLAAGYFNILADAYGEQRGERALTAAQADFAALVAAAVANDETAVAQARERIEAALAGFRAAPLSNAELARRSGQLVRYVALVPVEYGRGVRNGVITSDIEVQEALTFHEGAAAAFADLRSVLSERNPQAAAQIDERLTLTLTQIRAVAEPTEVQATIDELNGLLTEVIPAEWLTATSGSDIDVIRSVLDQVGSAAAQGDYQRAESARLEAYALLELGVEQRLRGFAPEMAAHVESLFWQGTGDHTGLATLLASNAPLAEVRATLNALNTAFDDAALLLGGQIAPAAVTGNAAVIVFREGLEAVLILASLMASLRTAEQRRYRRPLLIGVVLASAAAVVTWALATGLLTVLLPLGETLEAITSLIAIGVLLLVTNWFFHKTYWVGWMANFHARKQRLVGGVAITIGQSLGLVLLGFTSVYREGFETVLFLQSLVLEAGTTAVLQGVALGLLGTTVVGVITFALQVRLPYKKMLIVTGVMIGVVLLTMVGITVHVMQSLGWLPITPIAGVYLPYWMGQWFGLYATWQGVILQAAAAAFVIGSYFLAEHQNKQHRQRASSAVMASAALTPDSQR